MREIVIGGAQMGAIQRAVASLGRAGGEAFFGEPALEIEDLIRTDAAGRGMVNVLAAEGLMAEPALYATVLLHLLGELFEELPEAGDLSLPRLILLLDEATSGALVSQLMTSADGGAASDFYAGTNVLAIVMQVNLDLVSDSNNRVFSLWATSHAAK